jgi:hypothetical protein
LRQHIGANESVVCRKLFLEFRERLLVAGQLVFFEQQADAGDVGLRIFQVLIHREFGRPDKSG